MKFFCVCTKPLYGPEHVYSLHKQLRLFYSGPVEMSVYTDRPELFDDTVNVIAINHTLCERQWYKMDFMGPMNDHLDEPIIVMDIDMTIISCVDSIIDTPIFPNEFYAIERWWRRPGSSMKINGGMYKYYPKTCRSAYDQFYQDPVKWQNNYREYSPAEAVTGEQRYVWESINKTHNIKTFPGETIIRHIKDNPNIQEFFNKTYCNTFNLPFMRMAGQYHSKILIIHGRGLEYRPL